MTRREKTKVKNSGSEINKTDQKGKEFSKMRIWASSQSDCSGFRHLFAW